LTLRAYPYPAWVTLEGLKKERGEHALQALKRLAEAGQLIDDNLTTG